MKTSSAITHPYITIHSFFSCFHLHEALEDINRLFRWACKEDYYKKRAPGSLLMMVQRLRELFSAAEMIHYSGERNLSVILSDEAIIHWPAEAANPGGRRCTAWQCCPRHLTAKEYLNPYLAFEKLARLPPWKPVLQELLECALNSHSIEGSLPIGKVIKWRDMMMAVVEACWLVEVRNKE